jgi:DsbC/DsbD-like thiol-disulfide interchange protein
MARRYPQRWLSLAAALATWLTISAALAGGTRSDSEVKVAVEADKPDADGKQVITVKLEINRGWHIYSNPVGNDDLAAAQTVVKVDGKVKPVAVKIDYPKAHIIDDKILGKYGTYGDKVAIKATVQRAPGDSGPLDVSVRFQACNDRGSCLFPATVRRKVP